MYVNPAHLQYCGLMHMKNVRSRTWFWACSNWGNDLREFPHHYPPVLHTSVRYFSSSRNVTEKEWYWLLLTIRSKRIFFWKKMILYMSFRRYLPWKVASSRSVHQCKFENSLFLKTVGWNKHMQSGSLYHWTILLFHFSHLFKNSKKNINLKQRFVHLSQLPFLSILQFSV